MPVLSETPISLVDMSISTLQSQIFKSNLRIHKQARCLDSLDNLNAIASPVQRDGNSLGYSYKKKCQTLVPKGVLNSDSMQNLNYRDAHAILLQSFCAFIWNLGQDPAQLAALMVLVWKILGGLDSRKPTNSGVFSLQVLLEMIFPKSFRKPRDMLTIVGAFCSQMLFEARRFSKYLEHLQKSSEISVILDSLPPQTLSEIRVLKNSEQLKLPRIAISDTAFYNPRPQITYANRQRDEMKLLKKCYLCLETISRLNKFFDKRRFGILSNCDCMICYGCIRQTVRKDGFAKGSVICPSCSLESETIATNCEWIEGKGKLDFFRTYIKNTKDLKVFR